MNKGMTRLQKLGLRKLITVFFVAITFLIVPAFSSSQFMQAQAKPIDTQVDSYKVDSATVKKIQERAEDLGDRPDRRIGDTGLKNIRKLGENIPETLGMRARQDSEDAFNDDQKKALNKAQNRVGGAVDNAKQAIQDVLD